MGDLPNLDRDEQIAATEVSIEQLEKQLKFANRFKAFHDTDDFQHIIMETMLGSEMRIKAATLVDPRTDKESEEETLAVLRSLRYLNQFISGKLHDADTLAGRLQMNRDYLLKLMAETEDM